MIIVSWKNLNTIILLSPKRWFLVKFDTMRSIPIDSEWPDTSKEVIPEVTALYIFGGKGGGGLALLVGESLSI